MHHRGSTVLNLMSGSGHDWKCKSRINAITHFVTCEWQFQWFCVKTLPILIWLLKLANYLLITVLEMKQSLLKACISDWRVYWNYKRVGVHPYNDYENYTPIFPPLKRNVRDNLLCLVLYENSQQQYTTNSKIHKNKIQNLCCLRFFNF